LDSHPTLTQSPKIKDIKVYPKGVMGMWEREKLFAPVLGWV
jgi:hypothetical protein